MQKIGFKISSERASALPSRKVPLRYIIEYLLDGETPGRVLTDYAIKSFCKALEVNDTIYEIGGAGSYYKRFFSESQEYIVTNIDEYHTDMIVDATSMPFETGSISAMASHFALEHIFDYKAVIDEVQRSLKPGGRFLLSVPFLYHYHAAPDDFFRFTSSALDQIFSDFRMFLFSMRNIYELHLQTFIKFNQLKFRKIKKKIKSASVFFFLNKSRSAVD